VHGVPLRYGCYVTANLAAEFTYLIASALCQAYPSSDSICEVRFNISTTRTDPDILTVSKSYQNYAYPSHFVMPFPSSSRIVLQAVSLFITEVVSG
jgi:hypothetical protein